MEQQQNNYALLKKSGTNLIVSNEGESVVLNLSTLGECQKAVDVVCRAFNEISRVNYQMRQTVQNDGEFVETYSTTQIQPALNDITKSVGTVSAKHFHNAIEHVQPVLQGQVLKSQAQALAAVYSDLSEMLLATAGLDVVQVAKSLMAKSISIKRDLELLEDALDEPLIKAKSVKAKIRMEKEITEKAIETGKQLGSMSVAGVTPEVLNTARKIVAAKQTARDKSERLDSAVKSALKASR